MYYLNEFKYSYTNIYRYACYMYNGKENMSLFTTSGPMQKIMQFLV